MGDLGKPPFSKEKRGFFISTSVVDQKGVHTRGGPLRLIDPSPQGGDP
jgi:hypothetical protein